MRKWQKVGLVLMTGCVLAVAGCTPAASAVSKFQNGQIGSLSASEWQALAGLGSSFGVAVPQLTPAQAQAIVDFLQANDIETFEDLERVIDSGDVEVPSEIEDLFSDFA